MVTFLKANMASLTASVVDYAITILLVSIGKADVMAATITGTVCGGL